MKRISVWLGMGLLAAGLMGFTAGCENGDSNSNDNSSGGGSVVGHWQLHDASGNSTWWAFNSDGSFVYYNDSEFTSAHLSGTYSQDGNHVTGPFTNPGVGEGEIDATVSDDGNSIALDFIEHWHSPFKHVPLDGTKI